MSEINGINDYMTNLIELDLSHYNLLIAQWQNYYGIINIQIELKND
jgi:hypothetical protein